MLLLLLVRDCFLCLIFRCLKLCGNNLPGFRVHLNLCVVLELRFALLFWFVHLHCDGVKF